MKDYTVKLIEHSMSNNLESGVTTHTFTLELPSGERVQLFGDNVAGIAVMSSLTQHRLDYSGEYAGPPQEQTRYTVAQPPAATAMPKEIPEELLRKEIAWREAGDALPTEVVLYLESQGAKDRLPLGDLIRVGEWVQANPNKARAAIEEAQPAVARGEEEVDEEDEEDEIYADDPPPPAPASASNAPGRVVKVDEQGNPILPRRKLGGGHAYMPPTVLSLPTLVDDDDGVPAG